MKLYIVRHGETRENRQKIIQGQTPGHLTRLGIKQAKLLGELLEVVNFDIIYSSDLKRTLKTTEQIKKYQDCKIIYSKQLRERNFGILENKKSNIYWEYIDQYKKIHPKITESNISIKNGESLTTAQKRIVRFLKKTYHKHKNNTVLFVTHGTLKRLLLMHLMNISIEEYRKKYSPFNNCGLSIVEFDEKKNHNITLLNHSKHLIILEKSKKITAVKK